MEEMEEKIKDVMQTDSQKSVATTNLYSCDFTDCSSEMHNSSGVETYVLDWDSEGSVSPRKSVAIVKDKPANSVNSSINSMENKEPDVTKRTSQTRYATSFISTHRGAISQEIFTQTSKTIIELAQCEKALTAHTERNTLQTQTSMVSVITNETIEYSIEVTEMENNAGNHYVNIGCSDCSNKSITEKSSKTQNSESEYGEPECTSSSSEKTMNFRVEVESKDVCEEEVYDNRSVSGQSIQSTDFEEDSLMQDANKNSDYSSDNSEHDYNTVKSIETDSVDRDISELYSKLFKSIDFQTRPYEPDKKRFGNLTPLTEESAARKDSSRNIIPAKADDAAEEDKDVLFTNKAGIKVKLLPKEDSQEPEVLKLPPIQGVSSPGSPDSSFSFSLNPNKLPLKPSTLPCVYEERKEDKKFDRWEIVTRELASGESPLITCRSDCDRGGQSNVQLPPIRFDVGYVIPVVNKIDHKSPPGIDFTTDLPSPINITDKIKELKMSHKVKNRPKSQTRYSGHSFESRSGSPCSAYDESRISENGERSCELLCVELLKRLRSTSWFEVTDTLDEMPKMLEKFWGFITEQRIADLLRQVISHVESPRTRVARAACNTIATILTNTNYTKKPDFYEAVTILLIKTGSFSRPVRRAANMALDDIVCGVDLSHVVTVLCIHGVSHKSPLVRCASARLLVVCCALGGGGRELLRTRPPTAASARKHALRSLAALLEDRNMDTRKYAERLYTMLRPLANFEAFYLNDVDVELATRQMKKYDTLLCSQTESR